jgi:spore germination protein
MGLPLATLLLTTVSCSKPLPEGDATRPPAVCARVGSIPYWAQEDAFESFLANRDQIDHLALFWYHLDPEGRIRPYKRARESRELVMTTRALGVKVLGLVANLPDDEREGPGLTWDAKRVRKALHVKRRRAAHVHDLVALARRMQFDGILIDYEALPRNQRADFTVFVEELGAALRQDGRLLAVAIHPKTREGAPEEANGSEAQDWDALARAADQLHFMTYSQHTGSTPGPVASLPWFERVLRYAVETRRVPRDKIFVGLPLYGEQWSRSADGDPQPLDEDLTFRDVQRRRRSFSGAEAWSTEHASPYLTYVDQRRRQQIVWFENQQSSRQKLAVARSLGLCNLALWRLGGEDPGVWRALRELDTGAIRDTSTTAPEGDSSDEGEDGKDGEEEDDEERAPASDDVTSHAASAGDPSPDDQRTTDVTGEEPPPEDPKPEKADEAKADEEKADEAKADEAKADEAKADEAKADEAKADEAKADEARADEARAGEAKLTDPGADTPGARVEARTSVSGRTRIRWWGELSAELEYYNKFALQLSQDERYNVMTTAFLDHAVAIGEHLTLYQDIRVVFESDGEDRRYYSDFPHEGIYLRTLLARYQRGPIAVFGGRYEPAFGLRASKAIYFGNYSTNLDLYGQLGGGAAVTASSERAGRHTLTGHAFRRDTSRLRGEIITDQARDFDVYGQVGEYGPPDSFLLTLDGTRSWERLTSGYALGAGRQTRGRYRDQDVGFGHVFTGISLGKEQTLHLTADGMYLRNARGFAEDRAILGAGIGYSRPRLYAGLAYSVRFVEFTDGLMMQDDRTDQIVELVARYSITRPLVVEAAYQHISEWHVTENAFGFVFKYVATWNIE